MQPDDDDPPRSGLRERKRRETAKRIADAGMRLFLEKGYDPTTLDEIATQAGISRRTFFYYYKSKDDILLSMQSGMGDMLAAALQEEPLDKPPFETVRDAVVKVCALFPAHQMIAIDRVMRASETVQARKQASYIQHEKTLFEALQQKWPQPDREMAHRLIAMMSIGAIRLSLDTLSRENGQRPLTDILRQTFGVLEAKAPDVGP